MHEIAELCMAGADQAPYQPQAKQDEDEIAQLRAGMRKAR